MTLASLFLAQDKLGPQIALTAIVFTKVKFGAVWLRDRKNPRRIFFATTMALTIGYVILAICISSPEDTTQVKLIAFGCFIGQLAAWASEDNI